MKTVSMKPVVQKPRKDGFWPVYIRFTLDGRCHFWKTSKVVSSQNVKSKSEITDPYVLSFCSSLILQWVEKLNHVDYSAWNLKDIVEYVTYDDSQVSFSNYARTYIENIDKPRTAKNYNLALKHLEKYMGSCELMFQSLTENSLNAWIDAMIILEFQKKMPISLHAYIKSLKTPINKGILVLISIHKAYIKPTWSLHKIGLHKSLNSKCMYVCFM